MHRLVSVSKALRQRSFLQRKFQESMVELGDENSLLPTTYQSQKSKKHKCLWDDQGNKMEDLEQLKSFAVDFYENLLGTTTIQFGEEKASQVSQLLEITIPVANLQWQSHCKGRLLMKRFEVLCFLSIATRPLDQMDFLLGFFIKHGQQFRIYIYIYFYK